VPEVNANVRPATRRRLDPALAVAVAAPLVLCLTAYRQGFSLLDDGLWLLGARMLAEGKRLYVDCPAIYGPARFAVLAPFFLLAGKSALALAILKAVATAAASGLGFAAARRLGAGRLAWLVPFGVIGLGPIDPRYVATGAFALLAGRPTGANPPRQALGLGFAWGILATFGLDTALFGTLIVGSVAILAPDGRRAIRAWRHLAAGIALPLAALAVVGAATDTLAEAVRQAIVFPVSGFREAMGVSWLQLLRGANADLRPFSGIFTGEELAPLGPLHAPLRTLSLRVLAVTIWPFVLLLFVRTRRRPSTPLTAAVTAFAATGLLTLLGRGDVAHLKSCWLGALWVLPALLARVPARGPVRAALALGVGALLFLPLAGETAWLAWHASRPQLATWARPTARIRMATTWIDDIEEVFTNLPDVRGQPMVIWPTYPGLYALMDVEPATRYVALLRPGEISDPDAEIARLDAARAAYILIGYFGHSYTSSGLLMQQLEPRIWDYLRRSYRVIGYSRSDRVRFRILQREPEGLAALRTLPLLQRLSDQEFPFTNGESPPLQPGRPVGQSFPVGSLGLEGLCVSFTGQPPMDTSLRLAVWIDEGKRGYRCLRRTTVALNLHESPQVTCFELPDMPEAAGRRALVTFEAAAATATPLAMRWFLHAPGAFPFDFCPDGSAFLGERPVDADLFFYSY
jgi:hypothetical protein